MAKHQTSKAFASWTKELGSEEGRDLLKLAQPVLSTGAQRTCPEQVFLLLVAMQGGTWPRYTKAVSHKEC